MLADWKTLHSQNSSLTIDLTEEGGGDLDNHDRDY